MFGGGEARTAVAYASAGKLKTEQEGREGIFHDVPEGAPSAAPGAQGAAAAATVGYDWPDLEGPLAKVREETGQPVAGRSRWRSSAGDRA